MRRFHTELQKASAETNSTKLSCLLGSFGSLIDGSLCKLRQLFICVFLFCKRCLKERHGFFEAKFFCPSLQSAIASDFVMLDGLRGAD